MASGAVQIRSGTDSLTGMVADASTDPGKRVRIFEEGQSLPIFFLTDKGDIALNAHMCRAGGLAGGRTPVW